MENSERMVLVPYGTEINFKDLEIALKLAKLNAYNDKFNIRINNKFQENTNIIDYIKAIANESTDLQYIKEFADLLLAIKIDPAIVKNKNMASLISKPIFYTKVSPIDMRINKNKWLTP
jgi:hypothetical protein